MQGKLKTIIMRKTKRLMWLQKGWMNIDKYETSQPFRIGFHKSNHIWFNFVMLKFGLSIGYKLT